MLLKQLDIEEILNAENVEIKRDSRGASFDYCYNFFNKDKSTQDIEKSCLILWYYLSSWGMLRNSFLLYRSSKHLEKLIYYINNASVELRKIDVDKYDQSNIDILIEGYRKIEESIQFYEKKPSITLVTKIMLGVFGNVPAFDINFVSGFSKIFSSYKITCGFTSFNKKSLNCIKEFYDDNSEAIINCSENSITYEFESGIRSGINYPKAKIIDTYGFKIGEAELKRKVALIIQ